MDRNKQIQKIPDYSPESLTKYSDLLQRGLLDINEINDPLLREEVEKIVRRGLKQAQLKRGGELLPENYLENKDIWKAIFEEFSYEEAQMNEANKKMVLPKNLERLERFRECKERIHNKLDEIKASKK